MSGSAKDFSALQSTTPVDVAETVRNEYALALEICHEIYLWIEEKESKAIFIANKDSFVGNILVLLIKDESLKLTQVGLKTEEDLIYGIMLKLGIEDQYMVFMTILQKFLKIDIGMVDLLTRDTVEKMELNLGWINIIW